MNKGIYAFINYDEIFVVVCKTECPNEWKKLNELEGYEVELDDDFYLQETDGRGELEETLSGKLLVFKSSDENIYFKCPITDDILKHFTSTEGEFVLIQSELLLDENEVLEKIEEGEIERLICFFYTEEEKRKHFELDEKGNILEVKEDEE